MSFKLTIIESPYSGDTEANLEYARAACLNCIDRNENPFASHLFYTQFLDDDNEGERDLGIALGFQWGWIAQMAAKVPLNPTTTIVAFYVDKGWSAGMEAALEHYTEKGLRCEIRRLEATSPTNGSSQIDTPVE